EAVGVAEREPAQAVAEGEERDHGPPEIGNGAEEREQGRQHRVERAAAAPGGDDAEERAGDEADDDGAAGERDGPAEAGADDLTDGNGEIGDAEAEVAVEQMAPVDGVLMQERAVGEAERVA